MTRFLLIGLLVLMVLRTVGRLLFSVAEGMSGAPPRDSGGKGGRRPGGTTTPARGEAMARDPVCGTYVVPSRAVSARGKDGTVYFCSDTCRQSYLSR